jgi:hypothetical protein
MRTWSLLCVALLAGFVWVACESTEDDKVNQAQACLDKATDGASANECAAKVSDVTGPRAAMIRCAAVFIGQGYTTQSTKFIDAFHALKDKQSGVNSTVGMIQHLSFSGGTADTDADLAVSYCTETGIDSWIMFASMARLATSLNVLAGGGTPTPAQLQAQVGNLTDQEAGEVAVAVADNYCRDSSTHDVEFCGQFNAATQNSSLTTAQIGALLKQQLQDTNQ